MDVVHAVENVSKGANDKPTVDVIIAESGELPLPPPETVSERPESEKIEEKPSIVGGAQTGDPSGSKPLGMASTSTITSFIAFVFVLVGAGAIWRVYGEQIKFAYHARVQRSDYAILPASHDRSPNLESRFVA